MKTYNVVIAAGLGISVPYLYKLKKRGMPVSSVAAAKKWRAANVQTGPSGRRREATYAPEPEIEAAQSSAQVGGLMQSPLIIATTRLRQAQAEIAQLKLRQDRGDTRLLSDYQIATTEAMVILASQLDGLPSRMASQLSTMNDSAEIRSVLLVETRRIRSACADRLADWAGMAEGQPDTQAAAQQDG